MNVPFIVCPVVRRWWPWFRAPFIADVEIGLTTTDDGGWR